MKYALIIGNDQYIDEKLSRLKTPVEDARELEKVMSNESIGGFKSLSLINKTEADIRREMSKFLSNKKPDDLVLVYFSGHGVLDSRGRLYLAFKDTRSDNLSGTALQSSFITEVMDDCRSKRQILILDCCHSGAFARDGKKAGEQQAVTKATFEGGGYGRAVLTASSSLQFALEGNQVISQTYLSLFTHYLMEGLKTGEADKDGDGNVSLDEWFDYTYSNIVSVTSSQKPQKWIYEQEGRLLIAKNPNIKKRLPVELFQLLDNPYPEVRLIAITKLAGFLRSQDREMAKLALISLEKFSKDFDINVSVSAQNVLAGYRQPSTPKPIVVPKSKAQHQSKAQHPTEKEKTLTFRNQKLRIFLCHVSQDKPVVRDLYNRLIVEDWIDPWLDEKKLLPGQDWDLVIHEAVRSSHIVIVCISQRSVTKEGYINKELRLVLDEAVSKPEGSVFIIPIRLEDCDLPRSLRKLQWLDYFPKAQQDLAYQRLLKSLRVQADSLGVR